MTDPQTPLFVGGNRNPDLYGFSVRPSNGVRPSVSALEEAAELLAQPSFYVDRHGYECDLFAAAIHPQTKAIAYLQSRSKQKRRLGGTQYVDVSIKIHLADEAGDRSVDIQSYNPFFGCDVCYFEWRDSQALLIYGEKHGTYACRFGTQWPPQFECIEDRWAIHDSVIHFAGFKSKAVRRIHADTFERLADMTFTEADAAGVLPAEQ